MYKCTPSEKVLTVELLQYKPETMSEQYQAFIPAKKIFLALPGFSKKLRLCNNSCTTHGACTTVDPPKKVLIVALGQNKQKRC